MSDVTPERRTDRTVNVVAYDQAWPSIFEAERELLVGTLPRASSIEHIGSTSVPGMVSKPTIDILVVVQAIALVVPSCVGALEAIGYDYRGPFMGEAEDHAFFRKVRARKRTHHLHVLAETSPEPEKYRLFRDFLVASPPAAARYAAHKLELAHRFATDRTAYVTRKERFVDDLMAEAMAWRDAPPRRAPDREPPGNARCSS